MLKSKPLALSLICIFCFVLVGFLFIIFNEKGQAQQNNQQNKQTATVLRRGAPAANQELKQPTKKELDDAATPVVDYNSLHTEPVRSERIAKNARYDGRKFLTVAPTFTSPESIVFGHGMSDLPADESNLIIEGKVADSAAYLSNDKGIVYSEFTVRVTDLVKTSPNLTVNKNDSIVTERIGGRVRYPDGRITRYGTLGQGSPMKGKKYLFFLTKGELGNYNILTAYELQGNKVFALDGSQLTRRPQTEWVFDKHNGKDYQQFKDEVEKAKVNSQESNPNRRIVGP